jgi:hypothetical protein
VLIEAKEQVNKGDIWQNHHRKTYLPLIRSFRRLRSLAVSSSGESSSGSGA